MALLRGWTENFDRFGLPDPLENLAAVLDETLAGTRSVIHGDLNLENVLAEASERRHARGTPDVVSARERRRQRMAQS